MLETPETPTLFFFLLERLVPLGILVVSPCGQLGGLLRLGSSRSGACRFGQAVLRELRQLKEEHQALKARCASARCSLNFGSG